jgi:hypothetical protein
LTGTEDESEGEEGEGNEYKVFYWGDDEVVTG